MEIFVPESSNLREGEDRKATRKSNETREEDGFHRDASGFLWLVERCDRGYDLSG